MTRTVTLRLPGTPTPKGRPRFTKTGRAYTDARTAAAEQSILSAWLIAAGSPPPHAGPVSVDLVATFCPASSWPKWRSARAIAGAWPHVSRPDLDNLIKVLDGLNGRAWLDDSQITHLTARKQYGEEPELLVIVHLHPEPTRS